MDKFRKKVRRGTPLSAHYPDIFKQIHPTLHPGLDPNSLKRATHKKGVWLCPDCDHV